MTRRLSSVNSCTLFVPLPVQISQPFISEKQDKVIKQSLKLLNHPSRQTEGQTEALKNSETRRFDHMAWGAAGNPSWGACYHLSGTGRVASNSLPPRKIRGDLEALAVSILQGAAGEMRC